MVHRDGTDEDSQPKNTDANKEYGRGNRVRKHINYSDEAIDDQVLNITEFDDEDNNNASNDYTPVEVPRARKEERSRPPQGQEREVDIDQLILKSKSKEEEAFFEDDDN
jgi:hypothetical protein